MENYKDYEYEEFYNIIKTTNIKSLFQPIISLTNGIVMGYEALSRGPQNSYMQNPEVLLKIAKKCNKLWELEELFRSKALESISKKKLDVMAKDRDLYRSMYEGVLSSVFWKITKPLRVLREGFERILNKVFFS